MFSMPAMSDGGQVGQSGGCGTRGLSIVERQLAVARNAAARKITRALARHIFIFVLPGAMLSRNLRTHRQPPHATSLTMVIVHREVLRATVVPHRERARRPAHAAGEFR